MTAIEKIPREKITPQNVQRYFDEDGINYISLTDCSYIHRTSKDAIRSVLDNYYNQDQPLCYAMIGGRRHRLVPLDMVNKISGYRDYKRRWKRADWYDYSEHLRAEEYLNRSDEQREADRQASINRIAEANKQPN